jgi:hypothetical protein
VIGAVDIVDDVPAAPSSTPPPGLLSLQSQASTRQIGGFNAVANAGTAANSSQPALADRLERIVADQYAIPAAGNACSFRMTLKLIDMLVCSTRGIEGGYSTGT